MYKNNQLWNRYFPRSQRISYRYSETPRCPSIYIIDLNKFLLLLLLTITKQKHFSSSPKLLFNYIVFESIPLLVVRPWYSENYIATISYTWEWASMLVFFFFFVIIESFVAFIPLYGWFKSHLPLCTISLSKKKKIKLKEVVICYYKWTYTVLLHNNESP